MTSARFPMLVVGALVAAGLAVAPSALAVSTAAARSMQRVPVQGPASGSWQDNGSAQQLGSDTQLTDTDENEAGDAVSPTAIDPVGLHVKFTAQIGGGSGADGLAFALLDASESTPSSLGSYGGGMGFNLLTGVAVTLDTWQDPNEPNNNFTGILRSDSRSSLRKLHYVATKTLPTSLRAGTHTVEIRVTATHISAVIDGQTRVADAAPIPTTAYLAFTGGTGAVTDFHTVRDVTITQPALLNASGRGGSAASAARGAVLEDTRQLPASEAPARRARPVARPREAAVVRT
jgi:opacity protein-like surface antigen